MREIELTPEHQHMPGEDIDATEHKTYKISFNQIYLSKPMVTEADGYSTTLFPKEARLRNLPYTSPLIFSASVASFRSSPRSLLVVADTSAEVL